jgi:hypothetical protein
MYRDLFSELVVYTVLTWRDRWAAKLQVGRKKGSYSFGPSPKRSPTRRAISNNLFVTSVEQYLECFVAIRE